jgi:molybdopterin/thiamine biosynthesis adenylyltransferase
MDGVNKARSARAAVLRLNSSVDCRTYEARFSAENGVGLVSGYDVVVDASDNPWTRYLISDACVLAGKPLVSAAALGIEGQATVYHYQGGPCYRCIHPKPMAGTIIVSYNNIYLPCAQWYFRCPCNVSQPRRRAAAATTACWVRCPG